jgi:ferric-dicitrate binding protein FerR (iron transport regulator)
MTEEEYLDLYEKHQAGTATPAEQARFEATLGAAYLPDLPWQKAEHGDEAATQAAIFQRLQQSGVPAPGRRRRTPWAALLAFVLLLVAGGGGYWNWQHRTAPTVAQQPARPAAPVALRPGRNQAMLTLADGRTVLLDQAHPGMLAQQGSSQVQKTADGQLRYATGVPIANQPLLYNTVATPRGGQYQLTLPDGSQVWLNAASSLRFPVAFSGGERRVELTGEAYFEVAKDGQHPFKVAARGAEVTVLGTHFDVQAYDDEPALAATLLEGSVRLDQGAQQALLRPGQQGRCWPQGKMQVQEVDVQHAVAWKNGYFVFNDEPIEAIMRQVARWYDVDVRYQGALANKDFNGKISRYKDAADVLRVLELTGAVHFTTEGRRITVQP